MRFLGAWGPGLGLAVALLTGVVVAPGAAVAANRDGEVVAVSLEERTFAVESGSGAETSVLTFRTDERTRITFERKRVPFGNLVPGDRVSVRYHKDDLGPLATAVKIHRLRPPR